MVSLGKLEEIKDLRTVWPHEALDFTPWLAKEENIRLLGDTIGLDLHVEETESSVGRFNVDIFATEMGSERKVIIENQLEDTNHTHLGQTITYAAGKSAEVIVWVVKHALEEHRAAIEWLNNHTDENISFFLCEIKLFRIGNSEPAVKFEVVEEPNGWTKVLRKIQTANETEQQRLEYWSALKDYAFQNELFAKNFKCGEPNVYNWMGFSLGASSYHLCVLHIKARNELIVELRIPNDKDLFHIFLRSKDAIEAEVGMNFQWLEMPDKKASRILITQENVKLEDRNLWTTQFDWVMDVMLKMKKTFKKYFDAENRDESEE